MDPSHLTFDWTQHGYPIKYETKRKENFKYRIFYLRDLSSNGAFSFSASIFPPMAVFTGDHIQTDSNPFRV